MIEASEYPKAKYSAYFEVLNDPQMVAPDDWMARIYSYEGKLLAEQRGKGTPDKWIKSEMSKRKV